ncbi:hypothetical protein CY34DRAFT_536043 [Suillus luteus UH-Slu-Lm8-n1]|uniref:Uncharacterized protein n=1 Tax=Suillus luteus UH-Slu-Lm8-n1 TaxID=930992 RepID=A0A0D0BQS7_9AGAM|nr:hypothetical protein CY34DRAFT_536043 [Suillus luteus UH-Slu-Lm8-n1]
MHNISLCLSRTNLACISIKLVIVPLGKLDQVAQEQTRISPPQLGAQTPFYLTSIHGYRLQWIASTPHYLSCLIDGFKADLSPRALKRAACSLTRCRRLCSSSGLSSENDIVLCLHSSVLTYFNLQSDCYLPILIPSSFHILGFIFSCSRRSPPPTACLFTHPHFQDPSGTPIIPNTHNILNSVIKTKSNTPVVAPSFLEQWVCCMMLLTSRRCSNILLLLAHPR